METDVPHSLEKGGGVEALGVDMPHNIGLLVELVHVEVFNSNSTFPGLLNMEFVGDESQVRVNGSQSSGNVLLELVSRVEHNLNPSKLTLDIVSRLKMINLFWTIKPKSVW